VVIAGGVEMMSTVPMRANRLGKDNLGSMLKAAYSSGFVGQGISAELIASRWKIDRDAMDQFALESQQRAACAEDAGISTRSIVPITFADENGPRVAERDEGIRRDTSIEKLAELKPAFEDPEMLVRYPDIRWSVTAGNSSQVSDGASAVLIVEESLAARWNLKPRAAVSHFAVLGDDPILMLTAIIPATHKLLRRAGLKIGDIDAFEVNEAFASVVLAWNREFDVDASRLNRYGGAIALGHPVGGSGGRLMGNLIAALEECHGRFGIQTMCESGGMANATLVERL
jgi:acetyl-CoA acyltransferase